MPANAPGAAEEPPVAPAVSAAPSSGVGSPADASSDSGANAAQTVSLLRYAPGVVLLAIVIAGAEQRADPDLWGHVLFGQAVLDQHHLVLRDAYSYSAPGHLWLNHEWLTEIMMALLYNHLGVAGLKLWKSGCAAATVLLLAAGMAESGASPTVQLDTLTTSALALMPQMQFRPQLFTFCLFAAILLLLGRHNYRGSSPLWIAVPLIALWANLHGGFIIGLAALGSYAGVIAIQDLTAGKGITRSVYPAILTIIAAAATLLTPYGFGTWEAVTHALRNPLTRNMVTDWQPLFFALGRQWSAYHPGIIYYLCAIGLIAAMAITFALTPRGDDLPLVAIAVLMSAAAFTAVRNLPLAVIASAAPVARHASLIFAGPRKDGAPARKRTERAYERSGVNQWLAAALAVVVAVSSGTFSLRIKVEPDYPVGAVSFMRRHALHGNLLGAFGWGEYLIWHMAPGSKVFIDGRYDTVFPVRVIRDYALFYFDLPGAARVLSDYPHDFVLIPPNSMAYRLMRRTAGWEIIYQDADSVLFARTDSPAAALAVNAETRSIARQQYFP